MRTHELKILPIYFTAILNYKKTFVVWHNDRGFDIGDYLWLREWDGDYSGRNITREILYLYWGEGIEKNYVCIAIETI